MTQRSTPTPHPSHLALLAAVLLLGGCLHEAPPIDDGSLEAVEGSDAPSLDEGSGPATDSESPRGEGQPSEEAPASSEPSEEPLDPEDEWPQSREPEDGGSTSPEGGDGDPEGGSGDPEGGNADPEGSAEEDPTPTVIPADPDPIAGCDLQLDWAGGPTGWTGGSHHLCLSPNGAVAARWSDMGWEDRGFYKLTSGDLLMPMPHDWPGALDADWHLRAVAKSQAGVAIEAALTGATLLELPAPEPPSSEEGWTHQSVPALTDAGDRVVVLDCWSKGWGEDAETAATLTSHALPSGAPDLEVDVPLACDQWPFAPRVLLSLSGTQAVVFGDDATLSAISLETGAITSAQVVDPLDEALAFPYMRAIVGADMSPDGERVALVDSEGELRLFALPGLEELATFEAAVLPIDTDSYMPSYAAPVVFSPDGTLLAHAAAEVEGEAEVWIRRVSDGEVLHSLVLEDDALDDDFVDLSWSGWSNAPVALEFVPDGTGLVVSHDVGLVLWRCSGSEWPEPSDDLGVLIEGPSSAEVGDVVSFTATHLGSDHVHSHQFFVEGEPLADPSIERSAEWLAPAPGSYEVLIVVDDGLSTGAATMLLEVLAP